MAVATATLIAAAAVTSAVAAAGSAAYSIHQGQQQKKAAKTLRNKQNAAAEEQKQEALETRRGQIDAQRAQMEGVIGNGGYSINRTSGTGRKTQTTSGDILG